MDTNRAAGDAELWAKIRKAKLTQQQGVAFLLVLAQLVALACVVPIVIAAWRWAL